MHPGNKFCILPTQRLLGQACDINHDACYHKASMLWPSSKISVLLINPLCQQLMASQTKMSNVETRDSVSAILVLNVNIRHVEDVSGFVICISCRLWLLLCCSADWRVGLFPGLPLRRGSYMCRWILPVSQWLQANCEQNQMRKNWRWIWNCSLLASNVLTFLNVIVSNVLLFVCVCVYVADIHGFHATYQRPLKDQIKA